MSDNNKLKNNQANQPKPESWADRPGLKDIKCYEPLWGSWYIDSPIGEGAFGKVYRIRRQEYGQTYYSALKIVSIPHDQAEIKQMEAEGLDVALRRKIFQTQVSDIIREINLMSEFSGNSHIVSFEDHKVIDKTSPEYLALPLDRSSKRGSRIPELGWDILIRMELLTSISDHVAKTPLSPAETVKLGIHICRALELCAKKNIIHRDIKPNNILVSRHGDYKLGDFGIARQMEHTMDGLSKKGTSAYMAPEVFKGSKYGAGVDIYGLGIVLYTLLNRYRTPFLPDYPDPIFPSHRDQALQKRINGDPIPPLTGISSQLNGVILKACAYDSHDRFASPTEMREALESVAQHCHTGAGLPKKGDGAKTPEAVSEQETVISPHTRPSIKPAAFRSDKTKRIAALAALSVVGVLAVMAAVIYLFPGLLNSVQKVTGYGISINGQSDIVLSNEEKARTVLEEIKAYYIDLSVPQGSTAASSPTATFEETVEIVAIPVQSREIKDEQEARQTLISGKSPSPEQPESMEPYLTVIVEGTYVITEEIDFKILKKESTEVVPNTTKVQQKGEKGSKKVTYAYIFKNGLFVDRTFLKESTAKEPVDEIVLEGAESVAISFFDKGIDNAKLAAMVKNREIPENVTDLNLIQNKISDITPLQSLTGLKTLALNNNKISNLTPLKSLTNLERLVLPINDISDLTPLKSLTGLKSLTLSYNKISNLTPLKSLTNLTYLNLENNSIKFSEAQKQDLKKDLPNCEIVW
ncbi:MAG: protein kinase [Peptococcaceae bacterium]|nr:protein kinase [Peptococcaceae bacterium]